jgi:hypothetical protein
MNFHNFITGSKIITQGCSFCLQECDDAYE